jgi:hypothetical protein
MIGLALRVGGIAMVLFASVSVCVTQERTRENEDFGPVVRAYLGYLRNEQEVVDDRISRREISAAYYRRNSNRIRALRQMAINLAKQNRNDYLPELEAVTRNEFGLLFERPPQAESLRTGEVLNRTFRFIGIVRSGELFYIFARLDPYEQSELIEKGTLNRASSEGPSPPTTDASSKATRSRRATSP